MLELAFTLYLRIGAESRWHLIQRCGTQQECSDIGESLLGRNGQYPTLKDGTQICYEIRKS